jgi:large subunit ribosomal protein L13
MTKQEPYNYHLDAQGQPFGRFSSQVASLVQGKRLPAYAPNKVPNLLVYIKNIDKISITEKKLRNNVHYHFTRYPGGLKTIKWQVSFAKNSQQFFLHTLKNMLPNNRKRNILLKMIKFE